MPDFPAVNTEERWNAERRLPRSDDKMLSLSWCHNRSGLTSPKTAFHPTLVN